MLARSCCCCAALSPLLAVVSSCWAASRLCMSILSAVGNYLEKIFNINMKQKKEYSDFVVH